MATHYNEKTHGKFWQEQREKVIERDRGCVKCGNPDAKCVHHIVPAKDFDDPEKEHSLDNLVTVCQHSCHWDLEAMSIEEQREFNPDFN